MMWDYWGRPQRESTRTILSAGQIYVNRLVLGERQHWRRGRWPLGGHLQVERLVSQGQYVGCSKGRVEITPDMWPTVTLWIPPFKVQKWTHTQQHKLGGYWSWHSSSNLESIDTKIGSKWGAPLLTAATISSLVADLEQLLRSTQSFGRGTDSQINCQFKVTAHQGS